MYIIEIK